LNGIYKRMKKEISFPHCLTCSGFQTTCCNCAPYVPFTIKDINRIKKLGFKEEDFVFLHNYSRDLINGNEKWWKESFVKIQNKNYKLNVKKIKKDCFFLNPGKGCKLGRSRPFVCRIYPFWIKNNKIIYESGEKKECHIGMKNIPIKTAMKLLNENPKKIRRYYSEIKNDCIKNKKKHKQIVLRLLEKKKG
jgi:Fe-S-cluster containining protein